MKLLLLASLRGNIILYQGEELGLTQVDIPFEQLQDPEAIANWPLTLSRDGARTPMPWESGGEGGFGSSTPWLPLGEENLARSVAHQEGDPSSLLSPSWYSWPAAQRPGRASFLSGAGIPACPPREGKNLPSFSPYVLHYSQIKKLTTLRRLLYYLGGYHAALRRVVVL